MLEHSDGRTRPRLGHIASLGMDCKLPLLNQKLLHTL